jgi:sulfur dioxygenase
VELPHPYPHPERTPSVELIGPDELAALRLGADPPLLLDVRPSEERALARLAPDRHIPLPELAHRTAELPRARPIVVYCHFGGQARRAAAFLRDQGFAPVYALEGGVDEYARVIDPTVPRYEPPDRPEGLLLRQFPRTESGCLAYLLAEPHARTAVVLDPGYEVEPYLDTLRANGWELGAIVETHTHADHRAGHHALHTRTDAPIYTGRASPAEYPHRKLADGEALTIGGRELLVLETPGHTGDHVSLRTGDWVFTGDTLLIGSVGRTDLGDGSPDRLWESLQEKLLPLPDATEVYPAHYGRRHALPERYVSNLGFEKATNEALRQGSREAFRAYMTEGWPPKPSEFDRIVAENLR